MTVETFFFIKHRACVNDLLHKINSGKELRQTAMKYLVYVEVSVEKDAIYYHERIESFLESLIEKNLGEAAQNLVRGKLHLIRNNKIERNFLSRRFHPETIF